MAIVYDNFLGAATGSSYSIWGVSNRISYIYVTIVY